MRIVNKIEAKTPQMPRRKRVAAYARVSMESERLQHSLSAQVSFYSSLIQSNPAWEYVGVYADNGITGTKAEAREEFNRMIADCEAGKIDIILTKSISRFARNTVDLLNTVRRLKELGVSVQFEKERIDSLTEDGELMLTLLASFAQEEIRSLSDNVKWGTRKRFEKGIPNGRFQIYGYRWEGDHLVVHEEEAKIVRLIYDNYMNGLSAETTEKQLAEMGVKSYKGQHFGNTSIRQILGNITYTGNLLFQKEYVMDPISKKSKINRGELPQYFVENTHEAIIPMEVYQAVQTEKARRRELGALANWSINTSCFTSKIKCGRCGKSYQRSNRKGRKDPNANYTIWICGTRRKTGNTHCQNKDIPEQMLKEACAAVLGLDTFDEIIFSEQIDRIEIPAPNEMIFYFKDGHIVPHRWESTMRKNCGRMSAEPPKDGMCRSISSVPTVPASLAAFAATAAARTTAGNVHGTKTAALIPYGGARQAENAIAPASRRKSLKTSALTLWGWNHLTKRLSVSRLPAFISLLRFNFPSASLTGIPLKRHGKISEKCPSIRSSASSICGK